MKSACRERVAGQFGGPPKGKTLDALPLTTVLALGYHLDAPLVVATHDLGLARASRALNLRVIGA